MNEGNGLREVVLLILGKEDDEILMRLGKGDWKRWIGERRDWNKNVRIEEVRMRKRWEIEGKKGKKRKKKNWSKMKG